MVDLERGLARLESRSDLIDALVEDDEDEDDEGPYLVYLDGTTRVHGVDGLWSRDDGVVGGHDPLLLVRLLADHLLEDVAREGREDVRGAPCHVWSGRLDSRVLAAATGAPRDPAPGWRAHVRAWIDADERMRRASWRSPQIGRPRSPLRPRVAPIWQTSELWDFGSPVDIEVPTDIRAPDDERMTPVEHLLALQALGQLGVRGFRMWRERRRSRERG